MLAGERGSLFLADWDAAVFLHFAVPVAELQPHTPFPLETWDGQAVVSLVAFTMRRMRLARCERLTERLLWPFREQYFLNLRTYVRLGGEPGITFLAEWISSATQALLGPPLYGLPYRWGAHQFQHGDEGTWSGRVRERGRPGTLAYEATLVEGAEEQPAPAGSFTEFVLERHTCFLGGGSRKRCFRIWHPPWPQRAAEARITDDSLLRNVLPWWWAALPIGAHRTPGVRDVWMGRPWRLDGQGGERNIPVAG